MKNDEARTKIETVICRKLELESQIKSAKTSLYALHDPIPLQREFADWRLRKESLLHKYANDRGTAMKKQGADLSLIEGKIETSSAELKTFSEKKNRAQEHLAELTNEIKSLDLTLSIDELLCLQENMADCQKNLDSLQQAISAEKAMLCDDQGHSKALEALTSKRENILADMASGGKVEEGILEKVNEEIAATKALHEKHTEAMKTTSQTISGLNRKVVQAEEALSLAMAHFRTATVAFLKMEIEQAGEKFVRSADKLSSIFQRIISLASLCEKLGESVNVFGPYTYQFKIPSFALDTCKSKECLDTAGLLFNYAGINQQEGITAETGRLSGLGLKLPL